MDFRSWLISNVTYENSTFIGSDGFSKLNANTHTLDFANGTYLLRTFHVK